MAEAKLWSGHSIVRLMTMGLLAILLASCRDDDKPVGMTLLFQCAGRPVVVKKFDPDGIRGPVPGTVQDMYPKGGAHMSFMPGDSKRGLPTFVDVEWIVPTPEFDRWAQADSRKTHAERYSEAGRAEYHREWAKNPRYTRRVSVASIITPELVAQVRADRQNTQLKVIITFNNDEVDIQAEAYKWR